MARMKKQTSHCKPPPGGKTASRACSPKGASVRGRSVKPTRDPSGICPIARECGACSAIDVPYDQQLTRKQRIVADLFYDIAGSDSSLPPIVGMEDPFRYRNKIASPFASGRPAKPRGESKGKKVPPRREILCGMYAAGTHRIIPVQSCPVEHPSGRRIVNAVRAVMQRYGVEPYDEDAGTGFMRHCVVRVGHESGEVLVTLVTNGREFPGGRNFARELVKRCPEITTVVQNVNARATNAILGTEEHTLFGPGFILDTLCGLSFRISSHSFYQVNGMQTEVLYRIAIEEAHMGGAGGANRPITVMDAYCGTGTIGLVAAASAENVQVIGVDNVESAIRDARQNAAHNGIGNAEFVIDDAGAFMRRYADEGRSLDVLLMDPPRAGSSPEFLEAACALKPQRIVYISCDPETQARDAKYLRKRGYHLDSLRLVDMFPHTDHVETVVLMSRKDT